MPNYPSINPRCNKCHSKCPQLRKSYAQLTHYATLLQIIPRLPRFTQNLSRPTAISIARTQSTPNYAKGPTTQETVTRHLQVTRQPFSSNRPNLITKGLAAEPSSPQATISTPSKSKHPCRHRRRPLQSEGCTHAPTRPVTQGDPCTGNLDHLDP